MSNLRCDLSCPAECKGPCKYHPPETHQPDDCRSALQELLRAIDFEALPQSENFKHALVKAHESLDAAPKREVVEECSHRWVIGKDKTTKCRRCEAVKED